jgi:uncharacterized protein YdaT
MPWGAGDATRHTKRVRSAKSKRQWSHVANSMLDRGASEGSAIRAANATVKRSGRRKRRRGYRR